MCGVQSKNTLHSAPYLCSLQRGWVLGGGRWEARWVELHRGLCWGCVWALEPLVTGHCQVGSPAGPARGLTRNAVVLSVVKELETLWKKSKRLGSKTQTGPTGIFFLSCFALAGRFKAAAQIQNHSDCHGGCDLRHVFLFFIPSPPFLLIFW